MMTMTNTIIPERLPLIDQIRPVHGPAADPGDQTPEQACVMQMAAWLAGEQWTDRPACVDPQLAALMRDVNDSLPKDVLSIWAPQVAPLTVGVTDASALLDRLAVRRLRESVLPLAPAWPDELRPRVVAAVEQVIEAIESGDRDSAAAAESATRAAEAAVRVARSDNRRARAARSAMWAAESALATAEGSARAGSAAMRAARLSEQSTYSAAAESAVWSAEADRILNELRATNGRR